MGKNYGQNICDAIEIITDNKLNKMKFNSTVRANIVQCTNNSLGEYKVKYQDSTFTAYSINQYVEYKIDDLVYILIPNNDFDETKFIIEAVSPVAPPPFPDPGGGGSVSADLKATVTSDNFLLLEIINEEKN